MTTAAANRLQSRLDLSKGKPPIDKKDPRIQQMQEWLRGKGWVKRAIVFDALGIKEDRVGRELKRLSHYKENVSFPSVSPQYRYAQKMQSFRVRVLRLMELQSKTGKEAA